MVTPGLTTILAVVCPPGSHCILAAPQPPVILLIDKVELPGAQKIVGDATTLKFKGTNDPGTTKEDGVVHGPTVLVPLTSRKEICLTGT